MLGNVRLGLTALILVFVSSFVGALPLFTTAAQVSELDGISSKRYIVVDADTGEVFVAHNADERVAFASLTKVFTTIEALELATLDTRITTTSSDLFGADSTTMGFGPGETFSLEDLLYGMMLPSGNDAAHAIARSLGAEPGLSDDEAVENFMAMANERIAAMGLTNTQLKNPHGLSEEGHYSTARDIATFTMYALRFPVFRELISTSGYATENGSYYVTNTNKLLNNYAGLIGGKTGYDDESGYCLIEVATRNGSTMISVTLDGTAPDIWYQDNAILLDYAFRMKAEREAAGRQISGERLSFRDPDAAVILAQSRGGNSIGVDDQLDRPPSGSAEASPAASPVAGAVEGRPESGSTGSDTSAGLGTLAPLAAAVALVALAIAGFCGWKALEVSNRRRNVVLGRPLEAESD